MKFLSLLLGVACFTLSTAVAKTSSEYNIIPQPNHLTAQDGYFILNAGTILLAQGAAEEKSANYFKQLIAPATGYITHVTGKTDSETNVIEFKLTDDIAEDEGYRLSVRPDKIIVEGRTDAGLFYGIQTLRQMLPVQIEKQFPYNSGVWKIPAADIIDAPRFAYRGMHLDVARSFFPVKFIKKYIDLIAFHKMYKFHWHLTDNQGWRIEIKKYPKLTEVGSIRSETVVGHTLDRDILYDGQVHKGYYTQEEIREIVQYAADRHIEVIPEIDIPGHATAMVAAYPELSCVDGPFEVTRSYGIFLEVLCPTEVTFNFLDNVFKEVAGLFPSSYIHIGGDEVLKDQWRDCVSCKILMQENALKNLEELQSYFVRRVEKIIAKYDRTIIGWDEILEGGMNSSAVIMSWRGMRGGIEAAKHGHDVIMTPGTHAYFDQYQSLSLDEPMSIHDFTDLQEVYGFNPLPKELNENERKHIKGAQGNVWGEYIHDAARVEHAILPRMSALAEVIWTRPDHHDYSDFLARLDPLFKRFDQMNLNAARSVYKVVARGSLLPDMRLQAALTVEGHDMAIRYTLDGSKPDAQSAVYDKPLLFDRSVTVRAVGQNRKSGELFGDTILSFDHHKALGKKITFAHVPGVIDKDKPEDILLDGLLARDRIYQKREWAFISGKDFEGVIDLDKATEIHEVSIGVEAGQYRQLYPPKRFEIFISNDNQTWQSKGVLTEDDIARTGSVLTISFASVKARYVKFIVVNNGKFFDAQYQSMNPTTLHIDEISVR